MSLLRRLERLRPWHKTHTSQSEPLRSELLQLELPSATIQGLLAASDMVSRYRLAPSSWTSRLPWASASNLLILFSGGTGTAKAKAAEIIARQAGGELLRIDLSSVVSKYIGETEKNPSKIFSAAEGHNQILFFDEADALFDRRSETKDSRDRYANLDTANLLERIERYRGVVVLTTNFSQCLDERLIRRIRTIVEFPSSK